MYKIEQLKPKNYLKGERPSKTGSFWTIDKTTGNVCSLFWSPGNIIDTYGIHVSWFVDIPGAPQEVAPLAYSYYKPGKEGEYIIHLARNDIWTTGQFRFGCSVNNPDHWTTDFSKFDGSCIENVDYFIDIPLDECKEEVDTTNVRTIVVKNYHVEQLEKLGYTITLTPKQPVILPCPNPECGGKCELVKYDWGDSQVHCPACSYRGPFCETSEEATRLHNEIAKRGE